MKSVAYCRKGRRADITEREGKRLGKRKRKEGDSWRKYLFSLTGKHEREKVWGWEDE